MQLTLPEELLLLAFHDRKGTNAFASMLETVLGGALLAELLLQGKVEVRDEGRRGLVTVVDRRRLGQPVLDAALEKLEGARRRADPQTTVMRLSRLKGLRHDVARALCRRGVLRQTEAEVLLLFRRRVYPTVNPEPERALIERIRDALEGGAPPDERTATLIGLADAAGALSAIYDRKERKALKKRIEAIRESTAAGSATRDAIEAIQAAIVVTTVIT